MCPRVDADTFSAAVPGGRTRVAIGRTPPRTSDQIMKSRLPLSILPVLAVLAGCVSAPPAEMLVRRQVEDAAHSIDPGARDNAWSPLDKHAPVEAFVRFAAINHPAVAAAHAEWQAAVESIVPARALPDPRFTLEADIADALMTFMPGFMADLTSVRSRTAMAEERIAGAEAARHAFELAVLQTAAETRKAWIDLAWIDEERRLHRESAAAVEAEMEVANAGYETGKSMDTLERQLRLANDAAAHHTHHASLGDRLLAARVRFKAALGLGPGDRDPPWPDARLAQTTLPSDEQLWQLVLSRNPDLARMRSMIDMAVAEVEVARSARTPVLSAGIMADLRASPVMIRPAAAISLPVWRDKIAAGIAAGTARRDAATAELGAATLRLAAELADRLYTIRESERTIAFIDQTALPNLSRISAAAEAGYQSGMGSAAMIPETRVMELDLEMQRADALRERESAAVDLMLLSAGTAPGISPYSTAHESQSR